MGDHLLRNRAKIHQVLFGTHFCQTDPDLLERLQSCKGARVVPQTGRGTFHPKVFGFASGDRRAAIIGSANFTNAGFGSNIEAAVWLEGRVGDEPLDTALSFVDAQWRQWRTRGQITDEFLAAYRRQYESNARLRQAMERPPFVPRRRGGEPEHDLLNMDWPDYLRVIDEAENAVTIPDRVEILNRTRRLFDGRAFADFNRPERRAVAGMMDKEQAEEAGLGRLDWRLFGSMLGSGEFQKRINANSRFISAALEHIPPQGEVTKEQFESYCGDFLRAFEDAERQPHVASMTRLPALKRPDYFVCLDARNRVGLGKDVGFAHSRLDITQYWDDVIEPLLQTEWWRKERPPGQNGRLWDGRVAMLDVMYYDD